MWLKEAISRNKPHLPLPNERAKSRHLPSIEHLTMLTRKKILRRDWPKKPKKLSSCTQGVHCPAIATWRPWCHFKSCVCTQPRSAMEHSLSTGAFSSQFISKPLKTFWEQGLPRADGSDLCMPRGSTVVTNTRTHTPSDTHLSSRTLRPE